MQVKKHLDILSDKYRKYVSSMILDKNEYFFVYGTDLTEQDTEKLLLNDEHVALFVSLEDCLIYLHHYESQLFDKQRTLKWSKEFEKVFDKHNVRQYTYHQYDLDKIRQTIGRNNLGRLLAKSSIELLDFINLVEDYAEQTNSEPLNTLLNARITRDWLERVYNADVFAERHGLKSAVNSKTGKLLLNLREIYRIFIGKLIIFDFPQTAMKPRPFRQVVG